MSGDDADFEAYLAARWPLLVRSLVLVGLPRLQAEDVVVGGLARCRSAWRRLQEVDDVDAHVWAAVLAGRDGPVPPRAVVVPDDPSQDEELRLQLEEQLDRLTSEQREAVVLCLVAGLDEVQLADVLDIPVSSAAGRLTTGLAAIDPPALRSEDAFRTASGSIEVGASPYDRVVARAREQRRRRWRTAALSVGAVAVVVGVAGWLTSGSRDAVPPGPPKPSPEVVTYRNPVAPAWYDGDLHLRLVSVRLPGLTSLAAIGESAAYVDIDGAVGVVRPDGSVHVVGRATAGALILGSPENGWAVWIEPGSTESRIVVWSVDLDAEVGSLAVSPQARLLAVDEDRIYATGTGTFVWTPPGPRIQPADVALVAGGPGTHVYQRGRRIEVVQTFFNSRFTQPGVGATVSPGGTVVLTRAPGPWVDGAPYRPLLYETRTGARLPSGIAPDELVVDAAFGDNHEIDYLVVNRRDLHGVDLDGARSRLYVLRTCELERPVCSDVVPVRSAGGRAMFAS